MTGENEGSDETENRPHRVVGIGASAGGLEACKRLFGVMPGNTGMAFIVVMHLAPSHESHIAELLNVATALSVVQASGAQPLQPNCVYVIAPDSSLEVRDGVLHTTVPRDPRGDHKPVDALLSSLAQDAGERAVAVILSGTGNDGSTALGEIKGRGGLCIVQTPEDARYDGMPRSAIATGIVDHVLPLDMIPKALLDAAGRSDALDTGRADQRPGMSPFDRILDLLGRAYGINFRGSYKRGTIERRTRRRMDLEHASSEEAYLDLLQKNPHKVAELYRDVLIDVTEFFRDPEVWTELERTFFPGMFARADPDMPLKIWVAGCATGEEAYSLAMLALEEIERRKNVTKVQIFATDVSEDALMVARRGLYPGSIERTVSSERLSRFFRRQGDQFQIHREVRDCVTFARHNILVDPPFAHLDLLSCRNMLIYLESHAQQRALRMFDFALKPGGLLLLGASETVGRYEGELFECVSNPARVYRALRRHGTQRNRTLPWASEAAIFRGPPGVHPIPPKGPNVSRAIEQIVLSRYTWACVVVTKSFEIQSFFGPTHDYVQPPTGEARMDLLAWARPGIYPRLWTALEQARDEGRRVEVTDMRVERGGRTHRVACTIEPITPLPGEARMLLVAFRDVPSATVTEADMGPTNEPLARRLEAELKSAREEQQRTLEQLEITNEEHRASHEELLSLNEELQSSNEELEASTEELQSLNEEMVTVNRQLEDKNTELRVANADVNNLLISAGVPIIFLDRGLRVRRFTPAATEVMNLVWSDVGRSIQHIKQRSPEDGLMDEARQVLESLTPLQTELETDGGRWYARDIRPYRTEDDRIDGVCITFSDITAGKVAAREHEEARRSTEAILAESPVPLLAVDGDMRVVLANASFCDMFKVSCADTEGMLLYDLGDGQWDIPKLRELLERVLPEQEVVRNFEVEHDFEHLGRRTLLLSARQISRGDMPPLILLHIDDLTERMRVQRALEQETRDLAEEHRRKDEFLAMLGHELRNPLSALMHGLDVLDLSPTDTSRAQRVHSMMRRQGNRIASMLDQLLDLARLTAGKIQLSHVPVDMSEAVQTAVEAVAPLAEARKQKLEVSLPAQETVLVQGDLARLAQVLENLLNNAVKYTDQGGSISLSMEADDHWVRLRVRDTGIGMDSEFVPHLFELFTQAPRSLDRTGGGLGLGLPLVERVVELHGGTVQASSPGRGRGSEFVVTLPRMSERRGARDGADGRIGGPRCRILVVDDEEDSAAMLATILSIEGHESRAVYDGPSALEVARTFRPEVVLLDLGLPDMDGYEIARRLREEHDHDQLLIVALTGYQKDQERLESAGFDHHLLKPLDRQALAQWLAQRDART
jgi:two-component system, chemotaxis family, CheB/CheR fusion protein